MNQIIYRTKRPNKLPSTFSTQCEIANSLRRNTAAGHDKVPMWCVKESISHISEPLTYIITLFITSGVVPDQMKLACVVPLFKSDDKRLYSNYRPVLPILFSKFLEKDGYIRVINCIDKHMLLANNQYGLGKITLALKLCYICMIKLLLLLMRENIRLVYFLTYLKPLMVFNR